MTSGILTVPGYHGSEPGHWQSWLERDLPHANRVARIDWEAPVLHAWATEIVRALDAAPTPSIIVAHSFGCLATTLAIARRRQRVAGVILVAPADPRRFTVLGVRNGAGSRDLGIAPFLPQIGLGIPGYLIGSENDPWLELNQGVAFAKQWKLGFINAGAAGHINVASGHGHWPWINALTLSLAQRLNRFHPDSAQSLEAPRAQLAS